MAIRQSDSASNHWGKERRLFLRESCSRFTEYAGTISLSRGELESLVLAYSARIRLVPPYSYCSIRKSIEIAFLASSDSSDSLCEREKALLAHLELELLGDVLEGMRVEDQSGYEQAKLTRGLVKEKDGIRRLSIAIETIKKGHAISLNELKILNVSAASIRRLFGEWQALDEGNSAGASLPAPDSRSQHSSFIDSDISSNESASGNQGGATSRAAAERTGQWMVTADKNHLFGLYARTPDAARACLLAYAEKLSSLGELTPELAYSILRADSKNGDSTVVDRLVELVGYRELREIALHEKRHGCTAPGVVGNGYSAQHAREALCAGFESSYVAGGAQGKVGYGATTIFTNDEMYENGVYDYS